MSDQTSETDTDIIARIIDGNQDDYALLMERYEMKLHRYVTYLIHDQTAASDVVQDTFIKAYQNLRGYNPKFKFSSWIYRIAHNEAINTVRAHRYRTDTDIETLPQMSYDDSLGDKIDAGILKAHVDGCIDALDQRYREVIQLHYLEHMKYEEVSDVLHIPVSTVGVRLSRAKERLRHICLKKGVKL